MPLTERDIDADLEAHQELYKQLAAAILCGYCNNRTTIDSGHQCQVCGRILCETCGDLWKVCLDHVPLCYHPDLIPTDWNQDRPEPARMIGPDRTNLICPICGFGWGTADCKGGEPLS